MPREVMSRSLLERIRDAQTKLAAVEFNDEVDAVEAIKNSVMKKLCKLSGE